MFALLRTLVKWQINLLVSRTNFRELGMLGLGLRSENRQGRSRHIPDRRSGNISRNQGRLPRSLNKRARGRIKAVVVIRARDRRNNVIVPVLVRIFPRFENSRNVEMRVPNSAFFGMEQSKRSHSSYRKQILGGAF